MARRFVSASSQFLEKASAVTNALPVTMACWFHPATASVAAGLIDIHNSASVNTRNQSFLSLGSGNNVVATSGNNVGNVASATSATAFNGAGAWHHACAVFASSSSRAAYLDGAGKGTNATGISPTGVNSTEVGRCGGTVPVQYFDGLLAEAAVWTAALTDAEVLQLSQGVSPAQIRPQSLAAYWPLREPGQGLEFDRNPFKPRLFDLTVTGATPADHPPFLLPRPRRRRLFGVTAAGGTTYNVSVSESATASDAPTCAATFASSASESASASDAPSAAATFASSVSEAATGSDSPSCSFTAGCSLSESGTASDSVTSAAVLVTSVTEASPATDSPAASAVFASSVAESAPASDDWGATMVLVGVVTESSPATDDYGAVYFAGIHLRVRFSLAVGPRRPRFSLPAGPSSLRFTLPVGPRALRRPLPIGPRTLRRSLAVGPRRLRFTLPVGPHE